MEIFKKYIAFHLHDTYKRVITIHRTKYRWLILLSTYRHTFFINQLIIHEKQQAGWIFFFIYYLKNCEQGGKLLENHAYLFRDQSKQKNHKASRNCWNSDPIIRTIMTFLSVPKYIVASFIKSKDTKDKVIPYASS